MSVSEDLAAAASPPVGEPADRLSPQTGDGSRHTPQRRPATLESLLTLKRPRAELTIVLDENLATAAETARRRLAAAAKDDNTSGLRAELDAAEAALQEATVTLRLEAITSKHYDQLVAAHPGGERTSFNPDTFPPALISACLVEPRMTEAEVGELLEHWPAGDAVKLFTAAQSLCVRSSLTIRST